jgi:hypothetical protein
MRHPTIFGEPIYPKFPHPGRAQVPPGVIPQADSGAACVAELGEKRLICFLVFLPPQFGQADVVRLLILLTSFSNGFWQSSQEYS